MEPADLQLPEDVDALKAMLLAMAADTAAVKAETMMLEAEIAALRRSTRRPTSASRG